MLGFMGLHADENVVIYNFYIEIRILRMTILGPWGRRRVTRELASATSRGGSQANPLPKGAATSKNPHFLIFFK
jgi:hypothetical protein